NPPALPDTSIAVAERAAPAAPPPLDVAAFRVPLWVIEPPPSEPAPAPPPPPPPPLRLQLLAIVRQGETLKASVYDPDSDTLVLVGPGDAIGGCTVEEVAATSVVLRRGEVRHTLALEQARGGAQ